MNSFYLPFCPRCPELCIRLQRHRCLLAVRSRAVLGSFEFHFEDFLLNELGGCTARECGKIAIPVQELNWFHSKWCLVSSSEHPVVTRMRYFTSAGDGQRAVDVMCSGALSLCSAAVVLPGTRENGFCWVSGQVSVAVLCPKSCAADCVLGADPYVLIKCENQTVRSSVQHDTTSAVFNTQVIFYRRNIDSPIIVQVR